MKKLKLALLSAAALLFISPMSQAEQRTVSDVNPPVSIEARQGSSNGNQIDVELELWNNTYDAIDLKDITIRYYFNSDPRRKYTGDVWYYDAGGMKPKIRCTGQMTDGGGGNQFCDIIFDKNAPKLAGKSAVSLETVFYGQPRMTEVLDDDFSKPANSTTFTTNWKIPVYSNGARLWGYEAPRMKSPIHIESYDARTYGHTIQPVIHVDNKEYYHPVPLKNLKLRYYFYSTVGAASNYTAEMWYENAPGSTSPTVSCHDMEVPVVGGVNKANMYCEVSFPGGDYLNPLQNEFHVDFAAWSGNWGQYYQVQEGDWSWLDLPKIVNKRIVAFYDGMLMWGELPK